MVNTRAGDLIILAQCVYILHSPNGKTIIVVMCLV